MSPLGYIVMTSSVHHWQGIQRLWVTNDVTSGHLSAKSGQARPGEQAIIPRLVTQLVDM